MLYDAISVSTCLATLGKIHCKLQETCYTLQCWVPTWNASETSLELLQEVESSSTASGVIAANYTFETLQEKE